MIVHDFLQNFLKTPKKIVGQDLINYQFYICKKLISQNTSVHIGMPLIVYSQFLSVI